MIDQEQLTFKEKYKNNPVAFCEDFLNIKLLSYQKTILNVMNGIDKCKQYFNPYRHGKQMVLDMQVEYMKAMEMDFQVWKKNGIDVYKKGVLVKTMNHKKEG